MTSPSLLQKLNEFYERTNPTNERTNERNRSKKMTSRGKYVFMPAKQTLLLTIKMDDGCGKERRTCLFDDDTSTIVSRMVMN